MSTVLIDSKDELYSLISMQLWKRVDSATLFPANGAQEEILLFQAFFEKAKISRLANFDLFTASGRSNFVAFVHVIRQQAQFEHQILEERIIRRPQTKLWEEREGTNKFFQRL